MTSATGSAVTAPPAPPKERTDPREPLQSQARKNLARALGRTLLTFLATLTTVIVLWWGTLIVLDVSSYIAKTPVDVVNFLFVEDGAADNRAQISADLAVTLGHAARGFLAGLSVAIISAIAFTLSKGMEQALMPVAMLLRSVPLIAMAPVIIMIFGRTTGSVEVIGGIVVLFPALVTIMDGLKAAPVVLTDVVAVYGGSRWTALRKVALPAALPALFAAVRISVPGAITGALLAEWLATGDGLGGAINRAQAQVQFGTLWAGVVVITLTALVLYTVAQVLENLVLARMGMLRTAD